MFKKKDKNKTPEDLIAERDAETERANTAETSLTAANEATTAASERADKANGELVTASDLLEIANDATAVEKERADKAEAARDEANKAREDETTRANEAEAALNKDEPSAKEKRGEQVADFMKPDYDGPLSADQAGLRHKAGLCEGGDKDATQQSKKKNK